MNAPNEFTLDGEVHEAPSRRRHIEDVVDDIEPGGEAFGLAAAGQHRKLVIDAEFH